MGTRRFVLPLRRLKRHKANCKAPRESRSIRRAKEKKLPKLPPLPYSFNCFSSFVRRYILTELASPAFLCPRGVAEKCAIRVPPIERGVAAKEAPPSAAAFLSECGAEEANGNIPPPFAALRIPTLPPPRCCWWCLSTAAVSTSFSLSSIARKESELLSEEKSGKRVCFLYSLSPLSSSPKREESESNEEREAATGRDVTNSVALVLSSLGASVPFLSSRASSANASSSSLRRELIIFTRSSVFFFLPCLVIVDRSNQESNVVSPPLSRPRPLRRRQAAGLRRLDGQRRACARPPGIQRGRRGK